MQSAENAWSKLGWQQQTPQTQFIYPRTLPPFYTLDVRRYGVCSEESSIYTCGSRVLAGVSLALSSHSFCLYRGVNLALCHLI